MSKSRSLKTSSKKESPARATAETKPSPASTTTSEIRDLIDFISKSGLNEVNIETKELKLSVKRDPDQKVFKSTPALHSAPIQTVAQPMQPLPPVTTPIVPAKTEVAAGKKTVDIKSPMIGTFYRSSTPDTPV